jgi:hypothetical protein
MRWGEEYSVKMKRDLLIIQIYILQNIPFSQNHIDRQGENLSGQSSFSQLELREKSHNFIS